STLSPPLAATCRRVVALGFDSVSFEEELGLAERGEIPLLIMMIGHERPRSADYRYDIVAP
ncbi:hypothetical protein ACFW9X_21015, partial [Streptomyces sp. NPDC059466]|uniref:hypothetical protein n=1 Tax=Streptomyces sp. NPDC059466 TaxID=3346843 RepID=UPI0036CE5C3E